MHGWSTLQFKLGWTPRLFFAQLVAAFSLVAARLGLLAGLPLNRGHAELSLVLAGTRRRHAAPRRQAEPLRAALLREFIAGCDNSLAGVRNAALLGLTYTFGLRPSEAVGLDGQRRGSGYDRLELAANPATLVL